MCLAFDQQACNILKPNRKYTGSQNIVYIYSILYLWDYSELPIIRFVGMLRYRFRYDRYSIKSTVLIPLWYRWKSIDTQSICIGKISVGKKLLFRATY